MITPIVAVPSLVWMLSFASFLALQFYDDKLVRRGSSSEICQHSIHQSHAIYFSKNDVIVSFDYHAIFTNKIILPAKTLYIRKEISCEDIEVLIYLYVICAHRRSY